ncbi:MAG: extracellular solute-binding protein [Patescibacteria group bacterium]|nr:extracellular solute-binding protein [Patescibacteria group bacterium]
MSRAKIFTLLLLAVFIITSGFGCKFNPFSREPELHQNITLEYWGVWDTPAQLKALIDDYNVSHPTITVRYRNFRYEEYERELLEAWADDRGPDVFAIPATWIKKYEPRLEPMPTSYRIPVYELQGTVRPEQVTVLREFRGLSANDIRTRYVPAVYDNVVLNNQIYGLPYSLDTLVTFYNRDMLDRAGIPEPVFDFFDLVEQAPRLTLATEGNRIIQSAVALGGTDNIPRFFDIFSSIMLQNGVQVKGNSFQPLTDRDSADRLAQVFTFYTDFARPGRASYSWNKELDNAFELFASGRLAYFFGYSYHADELRRRGTAFNWGINNFPQTRGAQGTKYYTNYWVNVVAKKSNNREAAWNFIQSTSASDKVNLYLEPNKKPTALRSLVNQQLADPDTAVFASQVLTADSWYNGYNIEVAELYLKETIEGLLSGEMILDRDGSVLNLFVNRINQTYRQP